MLSPEIHPRRTVAMVVLGGAALASFTLAALSTGEEFHPLAVLASLLPLQLAAALWILRHRRRNPQPPLTPSRDQQWTSTPPAAGSPLSSSRAAIGTPSN
jgi:hypothetical protein